MNRQEAAWISLLLTVWSAFTLCAALITVAGTLLSRGDVIADKTGLGGTSNDNQQ
jgi:hypothetical protein